MARDMFSYNRSKSRQTDYTSEIIKSSMYDLVLSKHLKNHHKDRVNAYVRETEFEGDHFFNATRIAEGTDKGEVTRHIDNDIVKSMLEESYSDGWKITRQAIEMKGMRIIADLKAEKKLQDLENFAYSFETIIGSDQECVEKATTETITKTRGLMSWLQPTAHTVLPFAERHLPAGEILLTASGDGSVLTEDMVREMLRAAHTKAKRTLHLHAFLGPDAKAAVTDFLARVDATRNITRNIDYSKTGIIENVDFLQYEADTIVCVPLDTLDRDTTNNYEMKAAGGWSGAFIELDKFDLEWHTPFRHMDLTKRDYGSGPEGHWNAAIRLGTRGLTGSFRLRKATA